MTKLFAQSLVAAFAAIAAVGTAQACSTLIIGKDVSATGNIIVAHNEDNGGRLFNLQHYVPPAKHKKGEMIDTLVEPKDIASIKALFEKAIA